MKRFLIIAAMLFWCGAGFAKDFYISCKGKTEVKFGAGWSPDYSIYNDDWKITIAENNDGTRELLSLELQGSSISLGRTLYVRTGDGSASIGVVFNTGPVIAFKSTREQDWDNSKIWWKALGEISLLGGTENFTVTTVYDDGRPDITLYAIGNCQGTKEVYAFLQGEKSPGSGKGDKASGTGFFINNDGYFVTNNHVIASCNNQSKISYEGKNVSARLIAKDKTLDLAL